MAPSPDGTRTALLTKEGIPQGDPLSSLAFAIALGPHLKELAQSGLATPFAFADDVMLVTCPAQATDALVLWERLCLCITPAKLAVWDRRASSEVSAAILRLYPQVTSLHLGRGGYPLWPASGGPCV